MDKKSVKRDLLLVIIFVAAVIGYFVFQKLQSTPGGQVKVTVDGAVYGTYDLNPTGGKAQKIEIRVRWYRDKYPCDRGRKSGYDLCRLSG